MNRVRARRHGEGRRRGEVSLPDVGLPIGPGGLVDEFPEPQLEHDELPETMFVAGLAAAMLAPEAVDLVVVEEAAAAQPSFFRTEESRDALYRVLTSSTQIDAAYVSFEDGYHRVVTRVDEDRKRSDRQIPAGANWHSSYIDAFSGGLVRERHRTFYDVWPNVIGRYTTEASIDIRALPGYAAARESQALYVTAPSINPDTGYPIISARYPIYTAANEFLGCASVNITFDVLSRYLSTQRPSRNSVTITVDDVTPETIGAVIALYERAVGFYATFVNINAYHQPGVEAGKKAASKLLQLQKQVREALSGEGKTAEEIARSVDADPEEVFHLLRHLASNDARIKVEGGDEVADDRFSL